MGWRDMENIKVYVNNEAESKEVQELFFYLGCFWNCHNGYYRLTEYPNVIRSHTTCELTQGFASELLYKDFKEITIKQLRDLVVLKRNDVVDANYKNFYGDKYYVASDLGIYIWQHDSWCCHCIQGDIDQIKNMERIKDTGGDVSALLPINKEIKEYINKFTGEVKETDGIINSADWVDIPVGTTCIKFKGDRLVFENEFSEVWCDDSKQWCDCEKVGSKHSHYKKDVSNYDFVDVYRVLDVFAVEHPCIQHAIKKLLCAGQRGLKGRDQDVQEAIDSLVRYQEMRGEDNANT